MIFIKCSDKQTQLRLELSSLPNRFVVNVFQSSHHEGMPNRSFGLNISPLSLAVEEPDRREGIITGMG